MANKTGRRYVWHVYQPEGNHWVHDAATDPRGAEYSHLDPDTFAREVADRISLPDGQRVTVWAGHSGIPAGIYPKPED